MPVVLILGAPGSGKGTQGELIEAEFGILKISTGDMMRAAAKRDDEFGRKIKAIIEAGELVPDQIIIDILKRRIAEPDCKNGFILDGFPRTPAQAEALRAAGVHVDHVIVLNVADDEIVDRLSGRLVDPTTNRTYNANDLPAGVDKAALVHRADDDPVKVRKRLEIYHRDTEPLVEWYKKEMQTSRGQFAIVDGSDDPNDVKDVIFDLLRDQDRAAEGKKNF